MRTKISNMTDSWKTILFVIFLYVIGITYVFYVYSENFSTLLNTRLFKVSGSSTLSHRVGVSRKWQAVGESKDLYIFSAYYNEDTRDVEVISLLARNKTNSRFTCYTETEKWIYVNGSVQIIDNPPKDMNFLTVILRCPLPDNSRPREIGIQLNNHTLVLHVIYNPQRLYNFTVCVPGLYGPFSDYHRLIETIETDRMFGAQRFVVYNHSVTSKVNHVLSSYQSKGIVDIVQWDVPVLTHYYGQWAHIEDCLLYSRYKSRYLVIKDLDELIIPRKHKNWLEMLNDVEKNNPKIGSFMFLNSFFHLKWPHDIQGFEAGELSQKLKITSLTHVWRENRFYVAHSRSKSIYRPERVVVAGIHYTMEFVKGYGEKSVATDVAYLHHYRDVVADTSDRLKDELIRKYADELIRRVNDTLFEVQVWANKTLKDV